MLTGKQLVVIKKHRRQHSVCVSYRTKNITLFCVVFASVDIVLSVLAFSLKLISQFRNVISGVFADIKQQIILYGYQAFFREPSKYFPGTKKSAFSPPIFHEIYIS